MAALVDGSGLAPAFEAGLTSIGPDGTPERRGRRRALAVRTLLIGIALTAIDSRELHLVRVRRILKALTWREHDILGISKSQVEAIEEPRRHRAVSRSYTPGSGSDPPADTEPVSVTV